jgi:hypothetical protein
MGRSSPHPFRACCQFFVLRVRVEDQFPNPILRCGIDDRPEQGERATFAIDRVLPCGKRDVPAAGSAPFPDAEAN